MAKFDEDMPLDHIPSLIYKELINKLNEGINCSLLMTHITKELDEDDCYSWIRRLAETYDRQLITTTPAENILFELNIKMCTVGILCTLLKECKLDSVWPVLYHPEPLIIVKHPSDDMESDTLKVVLRQKLCLSCKATGIPLPSYQWYRNNIELRYETEPEIDITIYSCKEAGEYNCKISQVTEDGKALNTVLLTKSVFVTISDIPIVIQQQPLTFLEIKEGEDFIIECMAHGHPKPCYQWFRDNTMLEGETSNVLHIKQFNFNCEGKYYCYISNGVSEVITQKTRVMIEFSREKATAKIALIIANDEYENLEDLRTPRYDAKTIANLLKKIDFKVICFLNLSLEQMRNAIKLFSEVLTKGVYGLFYYCGHGFKMQESHMLAVDTPKSFLRKDSICESELLAMLQQNDPTLLVTILDMCQTVPQRECNPDIYNEIPEILETNINCKGRKNLRNLVQAYSTSSYCPSYERKSSQDGLYAKHLSQYISKNIPVIKVFEEVGKSIDKVLKGIERNQIPMFTVTITKPFHLTDAICERNPSPRLNNLSELMAFSKKSVEIRFSKADITVKATISLMEPYINVLEVSVYNWRNLELNFFNSVPVKPNNLFLYNKKKCYIFNPQICQGPLIISVSKNGMIYPEELHIQKYIPPILKILKN